MYIYNVRVQYNLILKKYTRALKGLTYLYRLSEKIEAHLFFWVNLQCIYTVMLVIKGIKVIYL